MLRRLPAYALLLVTALLLAPVGVTVAYIDQNPYAVQMKASPSHPSCTDTVTITVTVRTADTGLVVGNQYVLWSMKVSPSSDDRLGSARTLTDNNGRTQNTLNFGPAEGLRTVLAAEGDAPAKWAAAAAE